MSSTTKTATTIRKRPVVLLLVLLSGIISFQLNSSMLNPALPDMAEAFGGLDISPVLSLFFLAGGVGSIVLTRLSDFTGRKSILVAIMIALLVGTALCLTANFPLVLLGRVLQGFSSVSFAIAYLIPREQLSPVAFASSLGLIAAINGGVGGFDGLLGGLLLSWFGTYQAIFVFNLAFGIVALILVIAFIPRSAPASGGTGRMDWMGAAALVGALVCINQYLALGPIDGWLAIVPLSLLGGAAAAIVVFVLIERRVRTPLIRVEALRSRQVWPVVTSTILVLAGYFAVLNFVVVFVSQNGDLPGSFGYGLDPSLSALLVLSLPALAGVLTAPLAGYLASKLGWLTLLRISVVVGVALLVVLLLVLESLPAAVVVLFLLGVAYNGIMLPMCNGLGVTHSPKEAPGALSGLNNASFGIGASISIALVAPFISPATDLDGFRIALSIALGAAVLAVVSAFVLKAIPKPPVMSPDESQRPLTPGLGGH